MEGILEGLLFVVGDEGLSLKDVMSILNLSEEDAKTLIYKLKMSYEQENRGIRLSYLGNSFKLTTKKEHSSYYEKLVQNEHNHSLSQAALEVLAIVAYNEPVTRSFVDDMRGVDSVYVMRKLLARGFIKESGKSDAPGRPLLYKTTDNFLDYFGLSSKDDLPPIDDIVSNDLEKDLFKSTYKEENKE